MWRWGQCEGLHSCCENKRAHVCREPQIWNPKGDLLGKIYLADSSANMIFAEPGTLVVLSDSNLFFVEFAAEGQDLHGRGLF